MPPRGRYWHLGLLGGTGTLEVHQVYSPPLEDLLEQMTKPTIFPGSRWMAGGGEESCGAKFSVKKGEVLCL